MSVRVVAKRTVLDPHRSRYLWVMLVIFGLIFGASAYFQVDRNASLGALLVTTVYVFIPLIAIARSYGIIAGRRQNGSLRMMLSYPHSRRDIVLGTAIGRSVLIVVTVSFGFLVAAVVYFVYSGAPSVEPFLRCWLAALLLGVSITGFTVGVSASSRTMNQAGIFAFLSFLVFFFFWQLIILTLYSSLDRFFSFPASQPEWVDILHWLNPLQAYFAVVSELAPNRTKGVEGFYATEWFGVAVLVGWIVVPLLIGLWQFARSDL